MTRGAPLRDEDYLILSTIHSAKGQEWKSVFILNAVDGCPSPPIWGRAARRTLRRNDACRSHVYAWLPGGSKSHVAPLCPTEQRRVARGRSLLPSVRDSGWSKSMGNDTERPALVMFKRVAGGWIYRAPKSLDIR